MTMIVRRLDSHHDMTFGQGRGNLAGGAEGTAQRLRCRLLTILGEWPYDTSKGVPWWQPPGSSTPAIMGAPRDLQYSEGVLKAAILGTDGIATLETFSLTVDPSTRRLFVDAGGTSVDGDTWNINHVRVGP